MIEIILALSIVAVFIRVICGQINVDHLWSIDRVRDPNTYRLCREQFAKWWLHSKYDMNIRVVLNVFVDQ